MTLDGRTALVTGAGSGMGRAIATLFAEEGTNVVLADIDLEAAERIARRFAADGGASLCLRTEVSKAVDVKRAVNTAIDRFGALDVVVNSAGLGANYPTWQDVIRVNVQGAYYGCRYGSEAMVAGRGGAIVSMSTAVAVYGAEEVSDGVLKLAMDADFDDLGQLLEGLVDYSPAAYLLSKRMVNHITRRFAVSTAMYNVRVNAIAPGFIATEGMGRPLTESEEVAQAPRVGDACRSAWDTRGGRPHRAVSRLRRRCPDRPHNTAGRRRVVRHVAPLTGDGRTR